jgi:hypothetical protein
VFDGDHLLDCAWNGHTPIGVCSLPTKKPGEIPGLDLRNNRFSSI